MFADLFLKDQLKGVTPESADQNFFWELLKNKGL
jgi:hypothetical protein